ncbi:MAG: dimethylsulfonioproprionate lyase family protein [Pseudomonadota bacterium]
MSTTVAQMFKDRLSAELEARTADGPSLSPFLRQLSALDCTNTQSLSAQPTPPSVTAHLAPALAGMGCSPDLADAVRQFAGLARWYQIFEGEGIEPALAQGLVAGQLAGQVGLVRSDAIRSGLFLLAPGLHYPLHQHGALELYFVVSGRLTLQYGTRAQPFTLAPGEHSVTPSNTVHALTTHETPTLVIYAWVGDVESPNWWWVEAGQGAWERVCWERQPDAKWIQTRSEAVTDAVLAEAGEL